MAPRSFRRLVLTLSLAALATFTAGAPVTPKPPGTTPPPPPASSDPCTTLGSKTSGITYDEVAACYQSIPYNAELATSTLRTVRALFDEFYVFRDSALTPNLGAPFSSPPTDITAELSKIGITQYPNDYSFHRAISKAIDTLHDAHSAYNVRCYRSHLFGQALVPYAPVVEGKQVVRVFVDLAKRSYQDCEIVTIDGQPALQVLSAFADTLGYSKDSGVRLNQALASQIYSDERQSFVLSSGDWAERVDLPEKAYIDYQLQCPGTANLIQLRENWMVIRTTRATFSDGRTYVENVCRRPATSSSQGPAPHKRDLTTPTKETHMLTMPKKSSFEDFVGAVPDAPNGPGNVQATYLGAGNATVFYQLTATPDVGVIVVHTHSIESEELDIIVNGLSEFKKRGVAKVILDFQGNGGGLVAFASLLVQMFFPNTGALDKSLASDLKVSPSMKDLSVALFNNTDGMFYNAQNYVNLLTHSLYTDNSLFTDTITLNRNGRQAVYTKQTTLEPFQLPNLPILASFPWTGKADNIRILTDGRCGSACGMSTHYFHALYGVPVYAVGGHQGQVLSMFSFVGGAVTDLSTILEMYDTGKVTSPVSALPYQGNVHLTLLEVYANGVTIPLEYDPAHHATHLHLDFDTTNARRRDVMWAQVAALSWTGAA
ncbi:hypothetical protein BGX34_001298 [Mortierella sp. NVP85]|nr:hypothetical protein BGX34_001298 [Mortierella sp. NVP85]